MNKEFLERLYWACADETRHMETGLNLGELYEHLSDTDGADHQLSEKLKKLKVDQDTTEALENTITVALWAYERNGFINGFRLGMKLVQELGF